VSGCNVQLPTTEETEMVEFTEADRAYVEGYVQGALGERATVEVTEPMTVSVVWPNGVKLSTGINLEREPPEAMSSRAVARYFAALAVGALGCYDKPKRKGRRARS
jgi:hypothetical protein